MHSEKLSGNSRFTSVDYENVAMDGDSAEDNLYGQQLGIVKDAPSLTSDVNNLTALIGNADDGELKTNIEKFKGKHLPYGSYLETTNIHRQRLY
jgi:hypothetical protein